MRTLHTADWHVIDKNIEEIEQCLRFLCGKAQEVDLVVIAGDIFDSRDIKLDSKSAKLVIKTVSELADICPVAIVLGTASHDGTAAEVLRYARGKNGIHVSSAPEQILLRQGDFYGHMIGSLKPDAVISLIPQPTKQYFNQGNIQESNESISQAMNGLFAGFGAKAAEFPRVPHLLIGHWNVSGSKLSTGQVLTGQEIDISIDQMNFTNASAHLLGHIHMPQQLGDRTFYSGSLYPLSWGENHEHGFYIHEFDCDDLVKSEFVKTPCRKLVRFAVDLTTENIEYLDNFIIHHASTTDIKESYVRVDITTWQDEASKINKENITRQYLSYGAKDVDIRIIRVPRQNVRSETVLKVETLRDKLVAMAALNNETVPERILAKADALESTPAEDIIVRAA
jgi:DNA repair exonuclease SbcCD nuclease subunit